MEPIGFANARKPHFPNGKLSDLPARKDTCQALDLIERVDVEPEELTATLKGTGIAQVTGPAEDNICIDALVKSFKDRRRKSGAEAKLILAESSAGIGGALIVNIAKTHHWYGQIRSGKPFAEIAGAGNIHQSHRAGIGPGGTPSGSLPSRKPCAGSFTQRMQSRH